jgi:predicted Zn-dependent protease
MLVLVHLARGERDAAGRELDALLARRPDALGYAVDRAALHFDAGEMDEGLARLDAVLAVEPENERALRMRGAVLAAEEDHDDAG